MPWLTFRPARSAGKNGSGRTRANDRNSVKFYLNAAHSAHPSGRRTRSLATANALIVIPVPGRDAHTGVAHLARARDDLRASAVDAVRLTDARSETAREAARPDDRQQQPPRETWTRVVHPEPRGAIPFLAQQLAQASSPPQHDDESEAVPSVRIAARQAYLAARDSTVEFLSPTPFFDLRV